MIVIEIKGSKKITLTIKEANEIISLLETLESLGGVYDEEFTHDCKRAGIIAKRMNKIIHKIDKEIEL